MEIAGIRSLRRACLIAAGITKWRLGLPLHRMILWMPRLELCDTVTWMPSMYLQEVCALLTVVPQNVYPAEVPDPAHCGALW